jgi:hypothetical protein
MKPINSFLIAITSILIPITIISQAEEAIDSPAAYFPETAYTFQPVVSGTVISHAYVVQNRGTAVLEIQKVDTGWGCTAAFSTRHIPPGGEGNVTLKVSSVNYGGKDLRKTAFVYTNDPKQPKITLNISGHVENFVNINPANVRLTGVVGHSIVVPVTIVPEEKYPFKILDAKAANGQNIRYELKERPMSEGKGYTLVIENMKKEKGRYHDLIRLKTDSPIQSEISIQIFGYIRDEKPSGTGS